MNLNKHEGPMTGDQAKAQIVADHRTLYVLAIASPNGEWYSQELGSWYDLVTGNGLMLHGFLQASDTILRITDWTS